MLLSKIANGELSDVTQVDVVNYKKNAIVGDSTSPAFALALVMACVLMLLLLLLFRVDEKTFLGYHGDCERVFSDLPQVSPEDAAILIYGTDNHKFVDSDGGKAALRESLLDARSVCSSFFGSTYGALDHAQAPAFDRVFKPRIYGQY